MLRSVYFACVCSTLFACVLTDHFGDFEADAPTQDGGLRPPGSEGGPSDASEVADSRAPDSTIQDGAALDSGVPEDTPDGCAALSTPLEGSGDFTDFEINPKSFPRATSASQMNFSFHYQTLPNDPSESARIQVVRECERVSQLMVAPLGQIELSIDTTNHKVLGSFAFAPENVGENFVRIQIDGPNDTFHSITAEAVFTVNE